MVIGNTNNKVYGTMEKWNKFLKTEDKGEKKKILEDILSNKKVEENEQALPAELEKWKNFRKEAREQAIATKIARGEEVKDSEKKELIENNPQLLRKAKVANIQRKTLESRLKNARNKKEAQDILCQAREIATKVVIKSDKGVMTALQISGIDKAEENYKNKKLNKDENENNKSVNMDYQNEGKKQSEIENS